jgi:hypothetical protein
MLRVSRGFPWFGSSLFAKTPVAVTPEFYAGFHPTHLFSGQREGLQQPLTTTNAPVPRPGWRGSISRTSDKGRDKVCTQTWQGKPQLRNRLSTSAAE